MRLIDEKALKEYQMQIPPEWIKCHLDRVKGMVEIFTRAIEAQPTIDAEPVVHGHWIENSCLYGTFCSRCGENYGIPFNFCPNCGAKMDEEVKEYE